MSPQDLRAQLRFLETSACPACGQKQNRRQLADLPYFKVFRCQCGHRFIDPGLDGESQMTIYQSTDLLKQINPALENYYEYDTLKPGSVTHREYTQALQALERHTSGRQLLEGGCGAGTFLKLAKSRGWDVTGVDSGKDNIAQLHEAGISGVTSGYLDFQAEAAYDVVVLWDFLEHTNAPELFIQKAHGLLKPGGLLCLVTPHYPNILSSLAEFFYALSAGKIKGPMEKLYLLEHTSYFSAKTLALLVEREPFRVLSHWKTETDLKRYRFAPWARLVLILLFWSARLLGRQNRVTLIAKKT